ncbi:MAG: hypothetical protein IJX77_03330 [Ruminococcus sp.]|nr:hypothetical protein [Ruminococcus sp.]
MQEYEYPRKKHTFAKIICVLIGVWILIVGIDFLRFRFSDGYTEPVICMESAHCKCGESSFAHGIGYSFHYGYDTASDKENPDSASFTLFGQELYSKEFE